MQLCFKTKSNRIIFCISQELASWLGITNRVALRKLPTQMERRHKYFLIQETKVILYIGVYPLRVLPTFRLRGLNSTYRGTTQTTVLGFIKLVQAVPTKTAGRCWKPQVEYGTHQGSPYGDVLRNRSFIVLEQSFLSLFLYFFCLEQQLSHTKLTPSTLTRKRSLIQLYVCVPTIDISAKFYPSIVCLLQYREKSRSEFIKACFPRPY